MFRNAADTWTPTCRPMPRFIRRDPNKQPTNVLLNSTVSGLSHRQGSNFHLRIQPQLFTSFQDPCMASRSVTMWEPRKLYLRIYVRSNVAAASHGNATPSLTSPRLWLNMLSPATLARAMHQSITMPLILSFYLLLHLIPLRCLPCTLCITSVVQCAMLLNIAEEQSRQSACRRRCAQGRPALRAAKASAEHCLPCIATVLSPTMSSNATC